MTKNPLSTYFSHKIVGLVCFFKVGNGLRLRDLGSSQGPTHSPSHSLLCVWSLVRCRLNDLGSSQGPTDSQSPNHCGVKIGDADLGPSWGPTCTPILIMLLVGADCMTWVPAKGPPCSLSFLLWCVGCWGDIHLPRHNPRQSQRSPPL